MNSTANPVPSHTAHRGPVSGRSEGGQRRRRRIDPTTCEREYRPEELEFMQAVERYKRRSGRLFPTCSELLEVVRELGYVRVAAG